MPALIPAAAAHTVAAAAADHTAAWLDFSGKLAGAVAWPIAALILAWMFHAPIWRFLDKLARLKLPGVEVEIGKQVEQLAEGTSSTASKVWIDFPAPDQAVGAEEAEEGEATEDDEDVFSPIPHDGNSPPAGWSDDQPPMMIVLQAWTEVERRMRKALPPNAIAIGGVHAAAMADLLLDAGAISKETRTLIREASAIRNRVAHGATVTYTEALAFKASCDRIAKLLRWGGIHSPVIPQKPTQKP